jgi:hypothetical protein
MTVEPVDGQSSLERCSLLFPPDPRLGWVFRDRWAFYTSFTAPQPQPQRLPDYLHPQVTQTEQVAQQRLTRTLPLSIIAFVVLALFSACAASAYSLGKTPVPLGSILLALTCLGPGAALTVIAVSARRNARAAYELACRQAEHAYEAAMRDWQARRHHHEANERGAGSARPDIEVDTQLLPVQLTVSTLLSGLGARELVDAIVESMYGGSPEASRVERSMDDRILTKVCDALGASLARIGAALRALMGEPDDSPVLDRDERRHIGKELFSVDYRRQAHANISRIESYIHPIEQLGADPEDRAPGFLTCIALDSQARNVRSELLTDLFVQWVTHRVAAFTNPGPSVVVAGADELARRHLERLSDAGERRGVPLTLLFRRLRETSGEMLGGGAVAFMRLGNHEDATKAADFIGRDYKFVLSQITKKVGGNKSHTDTGTEGAGDSDTISTSRSLPYPPPWAASPAVEPSRAQLPYVPGPPPGFQTGPRPTPQQEESKDEAQDWRPGHLWFRTSPKKIPGQTPPPRRAPLPEPGDDDDPPGPPLFGRDGKR